MLRLKGEIMLLQKFVPKFYNNESKVRPTLYFLQPILQNMIKIAPGGGKGRIKTAPGGG